MRRDDVRSRRDRGPEARSFVASSLARRGRQALGDDAMERRAVGPVASERPELPPEAPRHFTWRPSMSIVSAVVVCESSSPPLLTGGAD